MDERRENMHGQKNTANRGHCHQRTTELLSEALGHPEGPGIPRLAHGRRPNGAGPMAQLQSRASVLLMLLLRYRLGPGLPDFLAPIPPSTWMIQDVLLSLLL